VAPRAEIELYHPATDPHQLTNLAGLAKYASVQSRLAKILEKWMDETHDSVPKEISQDSFHRQTGARLKNVKKYRGTTPGEDRQADQTNAPGPR